MKITITGCRYTPKWETLQQMIREATHDEEGVLTRISREDNGCNYRGLGLYYLEFRKSFSPFGGEILKIDLTVE